MLTENEYAPDHRPFEDEECQGCGRSVIARFGGIPGAECPACSDEFRLLLRSGKLEFASET